MTCVWEVSVNIQYHYFHLKIHVVTKQVITSFNINIWDSFLISSFRLELGRWVQHTTLKGGTFVHSKIFLFTQYRDCFQAKGSVNLDVQISPHDQTPRPCSWAPARPAGWRTWGLSSPWALTSTGGERTVAGQEADNNIPHCGLSTIPPFLPFFWNDPVFCGNVHIWNLFYSLLRTSPVC